MFLVVSSTISIIIGVRGYGLRLYGLWVNGDMDSIGYVFYELLRLEISEKEL